MTTKRLLIVDDEPRLLRAVELTLSDEGYEVTTARSAHEAMVQLAESLPDLVISDIRMPGMDGYRFAHYLRSNPRTELIPVIFLTAKDSNADRIAGFRSGVDAYITKPFEVEELLVIVSNILSRVRRTHAAIARHADPPTGSGDGSPAVRDEDLTEAEERVALLVARGLSNKEIAAELNVSVRTVETHVRHILAKKNFSNRIEIARSVMKRGKSA